MENFNPDFIKRLAMNDESAHEEIKSLPLTVRLSLGNAVDQLRRDENIVPMDGGKMSIWEQKKVTQEDHDALGMALAERIQLEKEAEALKEQIRQEQLEKEAKYKVERARAGLTY